MLRKRILLLDGVSLYAASRELQFDIDYKKLLNYFRQQEGMLLRAYYFTAIDETAEYSSIRPLLDWLQYNGYQVCTKAQKVYTTVGGNQKIKGNMNVEIAVTAMQLIGSIDEVFLFSGDGDLTYLVEGLKMSGIRVVVVSTLESDAPMVSSELRRAADEFMELNNLQGPLALEKKKNGDDEKPDRRTLHLKKD